MSKASRKFYEYFKKRIENRRKNYKAIKLNQNQPNEKDDITKIDNIPDMPQILASLDNTVELTKNLREDRLNYEHMKNVLRSHMNTLEMLFRNYLETTRFMVSSKAEAESFAQTVQVLFGKDSAIADHTKRISQSYPNISKKHLDTFQKIQKQIGTLFQLQQTLVEGGSIKEVANRQLQIIKELPEIFPEGAPMHRSLKKRINLLV